MGRPSALNDPETLDKVVTLMAKGVPQSTIAKSLGLNENTIGRWKKRKEFSRALALKHIELVESPLEKVRDRQPLEWLERHPEFRTEWAPPKKVIENTGDKPIIQLFTGELLRRYEIIEVPARVIEDQALIEDGSA